MPATPTPADGLLRSAAPSISPPTGGGAIRDLGEKFAVAPATGSASLSVPIPASSGRSGFGPNLTLAYDSSAGNGPFGTGWSVGVGAITRKTDKGLPRYIETGPDADVFVLGGAEDLVPVPTPPLAPDSLWDVQRYRPRVEGAFARIERWTKRDSSDVHWRTISKEGVTTLFGTSDESRIRDPDDPMRIFSWLVSESYEPLGNAILYRYAKEDSRNVDVTRAHERNRDTATRATNRYLSRVLYGNATPRTADEDLTKRTDWLFEVAFDYGDHDQNVPTPARPVAWPVRLDPFSSYRSAFEVRSYRLCRRILVFHHFPHEADVGQDCLVKSLDLSYEERSTLTLLTAIAQTSYRRRANGTYLRASLPPLELDYSRAEIQSDVQEIDPENLPAGIAGPYRLVDLDGEGAPGILTEEGGGWSYKRNVSPATATATFAPLETVSTRPSTANLAGGTQQLLDVQGDGRLELAELDRPLSGYYSRTDDGWESFAPFASMPTISWRDPDLRFVDLTGDGRADALATGDDAFRWWQSLAELGFGPETRVPPACDEEQAPRLVFADGTQSVFLADVSGDGLSDLVRVRNGEVCYWPNVGYGRFSTKVTMDGSPNFADADAFDERRIRFADVDGSGPTDLVYLGGDGVQIYANQAGNGFAAPVVVDDLPSLAEPGSVNVLDLLGSGTACLVWSSALPAYVRRPLRYVDLMGGTKPHLLVRVTNNLGAETTLQYAPSTRFYVEDRLAGSPWITRLPFPVQVVERVETYDAISHDRFVSRYAYHHGYFDGYEREFRGFGLVEQYDTEQFAVLAADGKLPAANVDVASHVPPVLTRTWFHTGAYLDGTRISKLHEDEYWREPNLNPAQVEAMLLPDTVLPATLLHPDGLRSAYTLLPDEEREACRALKGSVLRREVYGLDDTEAERRPYTVSERNFLVELLQPQGTNQHAVFFTHARETVEFHYARKLYVVGGHTVADPRVIHDLVLDVDGYGNVLRSATVAYGRRHDDPDPVLTAADQKIQRTALATYSQSGYTTPLDTDTTYRPPFAGEQSSYELVGVGVAQPVAGVTNLVGLDALRTQIDALPDVGFEDLEGKAVGGAARRRLLRRTRTLFRRDDLTAPLPLGTLEPLALRQESYRLAFTQELLDAAYVRRGPGGDEQLVPDAATTLGVDGGYVAGDDLLAAGLFPGTDAAGLWWSPSGVTLLSPTDGDDAATELAYAQQHFFPGLRFRDAFDTTTTVQLDGYDLLPVDTLDKLGNQVTATNDYRVLRPSLVTDANGNRVAALFDVHGFVAATAVMGKQGQPAVGDSLAGVQADLADTAVLAHMADPLTDPWSVLGDATTRILYDVWAYSRTKGDAQPQPACSYSLARVTHTADLAAGQHTEVQHKFAYVDGTGRQLQTKTQARPDANSAPRWVGSSWRILDNKGNVVREYEPFFSTTNAFEFARTEGVSTIRLYDTIERAVATVHPDHSWEKTVQDPWRAESWDANDTAGADPASDADVGALVSRLATADYLPTWYDQQPLAQRAAPHAGTPATTFLDPLGRTFASVAWNRFERSGATVEERYVTRFGLDVDGNRRTYTDTLGRLVERCAYDLTQEHIRLSSLDAGERWSLSDVYGKPLLAWDTRGHTVRTEYDVLRRPIATYVRDADAAADIQVHKAIYGESQANPEVQNLRTRVYQAYDAGGLVTTAPYDFKGNLLATTRQFVDDYRGPVDWSKPQTLGDTFALATTYDALSRPVTSTTPDGALHERMFDEAGLLAQLDVTIRAAATPTSFLAGIEYNARGQRLSALYGNGVAATYTYDPQSFRLTHVGVARGAAPPLRDVSYAYDAVGNVLFVRDDAQQTIFFNGRRVEPRADYVYDAVYRLVQASGREHLGQTGGGTALPPAPTSNTDTPRYGLPQPGDGQAMGRYTELYDYDGVGNLLHLAHRGDDPAQPGWKRDYAYAEPSLLDPGKQSNRLSSTQLAGGTPAPYAYDVHGNTISLPFLPLLAWDHDDRLAASAQQVVTNGGTPETTYYVYDSTGQRVRKVTDRQAAAGATPTRSKERVYVGGFETYREYDAQGTNAVLERETLHVSDGSGRIALAETRTKGDDPAPAQLVRYQIANHLGSSSLELATDGAIISYEEHYPYGGTSYQAVRSQTETPKRYRFTGKERDEESGLYYHGARYYAPWLGRWLSCDPAGLVDGSDPYFYARANPVAFADPNGLQSDDWSSLDDVVKDRNNSDAVKDLLTDKRAPLSPLSKPMGKKEARAYGNKQAADYRKSAGLKGGDVQAGHTAAARHSPESGINKADWDKQQMQELHSRKGKGLNVEVTDQSGATKTRTRHTSQEGLIDEAVERAKKGNGGKLSPQGQLDAANEVKWKTENVPMDQRDVEALRKSGPAGSSSAKTAKAEAEVAVKEGTTVAKEGLTAAKEGLKTGAEETLKVEAKTGLKEAAVEGGKLVAGKAAKFVPFVGIGVGVGLVAKDLHDGDYSSAAWDAAEAIPVVGDVVGAGHAGVAVGGALNAGLGIEDVAAEHGMAVEGAAKSLGLGGDSARLLGAAGAAISSITVAPQIALEKKIASWF